jgi:glycosyltransferase involved in cell wall biosynthesis
MHADPGRDAARTLAPCPVSTMVFTLDEEIHLPSCLAALDWCDDVIVVDSFSTDRTREICEAASARFFQHAFTGFGDQRNWALDNAAAKHEWILILDADERVTPGLVEEMRTRLPMTGERIGAFRLRRRFHMWGTWLRWSSLYPTWVVRVVHRERVRYVNRGHAETQEVRGEIASLDNDQIDENLKGIDEWFERQNRYSSQDARYELEQEARPIPWGALFGGDDLERRAALKRIAAGMPLRPWLFFVYSYVLRLGFLDGRKGLEFCRMKAGYQRSVAT